MCLDPQTDFEYGIARSAASAASVAAHVFGGIGRHLGWFANGPQRDTTLVVFSSGFPPRNCMAYQCAEGAHFADLSTGAPGPMPHAPIALPYDKR
jgi:hypothetical protein